MSIFYIRSENVGDSPERIYERDEAGQLIAEYKAYYDYKNHTYRCYPTYNPYAANSERARKQTISASIVRYE